MKKTNNTITFTKKLSTSNNANSINSINALSIQQQGKAWRKAFIDKLELELTEINLRYGTTDKTHKLHRRKIFCNAVPVEMFKCIHDIQNRPEYQRNLRENKIHAIARNWDDRSMNPITCVVDEDYFLDASDGQHTLLGAYEAGMTHVPAGIMFDTNFAKAAEIFDNQNKYKTAMSTAAHFNAQRFYDEDMQLAYHIIYEEFGLQVAEGQKVIYKNITAPSEIKSIWKEGKADALRFVLKFIEDIGWSELAYAYKMHWLIMGKLVYIYLRDTGDIPFVDNLKTTLRNLNPEMVIGMAAYHCQYGPRHKTYEKHSESAVRNYFIDLLSGSEMFVAH